MPDKSGAWRPTRPGVSLLDSGDVGRVRRTIVSLLRRSPRVDIALRRLRIAGIDLADADLGGIERCRLLVGRVDAATWLDAAQDVRADPARIGNLGALLRLAMRRRIAIRCAGLGGWDPDFSIFEPPPAHSDAAVALLGAHYFARPVPARGYSFTAIVDDAAVVMRLRLRFEELWVAGYDASEPVFELLRELTSAPTGGRVRETATRAVAAPALAERLIRDRLDLPQHGTGQLFDLATHQRDAVSRARVILGERRGVILADSVGLGKTRVALTLIEEELRAGGRALVITPAELRRHWNVPLRQLARSLDLEPPALWQPNAPRGLAWLSHTRLSRGVALHAATGALPTLTVVDEAHAFRSAGTRRYRELALLSRNSRLVLLTATPINNTPRDLYTLLRLFAGDGDFWDIGIGDLKSLMAGAAPHPEGDGHAFAAVRAAVMVRRTRSMLRVRYGEIAIRGADDEILRFPKRAAPRAVRYALAEAAPELADALERFAATFNATPYRLSQYGARSERSVGLLTPVLLRMTLLKRLESSTVAFAATVRRQIGVYERFLDGLERGLLDLPRGGPPADPDQLGLITLTAQPLPAGADMARLRADAVMDLGLLRALRRAVEPALGENPKTAALISLLRELGDAQVVIFTEYGDTAQHLWRALRTTDRVGLVAGSGAWLGCEPASRRHVIERFAPRANRSRAFPLHEQVRLLIATDVLSEGLDLHDAAHVISFDLPWNPIRLVQRIGRVDRLGSAHERVFSYHFVPDVTLERELRVVFRLRQKLAGIRSGVGADEPVLHREAVVDRLLAGDGSLFDEIERRADSADPLEHQLAALLDDRPAAGPRPGLDIYTREQEVPAIAVVSRAAAAAEEWLVALRITRQHTRWIHVDGDGTAAIDDVACARLLQEALNGASPMAPTTPPIDRLEHIMRKATARAAAAPAVPAAPGRIAARAARTLLRALARDSGALDADICAEADQVLARLHAGVQIGAEIAVRDVIRRAGEESSTLALVRALAAAVHGTAPPTAEPWPTVLAVLAFLPVTPPLASS
ncbi:MAG: helicase-related protein [Longimicrobiales bacterium]